MTATRENSEMSGVSENQRRKQVVAAMIAQGIAQRVGGRTIELTENASVVLERRYLSKGRDGQLVEDADGLFHRVAQNLSQAELNYGASEAERQAVEDKFYEAMRHLEVLPNSPTLMNAGRELQQLSACFVLPVSDSLEAIFDEVKQTALIHKSGGGTGFSFSRLRPEGDIVGSTGGVASGPVSFIRAFDTATDVVKQGGTRRGANMGILNVNHPDILKFIQSKEDGRQLNNFNISVAVTEEFMKTANEGQEYDLINPRTGKVTGTLNAKDVFDLMTQLAWKTGDPGLIFIDRINKDNPNPHLGTIESTNPCGEQPLLPYESCNLASINLARMVTYADGDVSIDWERLDEIVDITVHLLDNVIDMNNYPIPEIAEMSRKTRRIGLGIMGFADLLVQLGIRYDSEEGLQVARDVMGHIQEGSFRASTALAETRGTFPAWDGSIYSRTGLKMRNSAPTTIAPTGTISIIAGASSGIEPLFALSYVRNVMDNTKLVEGYTYFEAVAKNEGFYSDDLMERLAEKGSLETLNVPQWVKEVFRTSHDIDPEWHVKMQGAIQQYTDNSVSKTINFPHSATVEDVAEAYMLAYELGLKGITVYRDGSKAGQVLSTGETGQRASDLGEVIAEPLDQNEFLVPRDRPRRTVGVTERVRTGHGNMYVTINFDEENKPFEVFGTLGKSGGCDSAQLEAISRLVSLALRSGIDPKNVIEQLRGITCCPAWDSGTLVRSSPDAVALAIERSFGDEVSGHGEAGHQPQGNVQLELINRATGNGNSNGNGQSYHSRRQCPDCSGALTFQEGCHICVGCGYSTCS